LTIKLKIFRLNLLKSLIINIHGNFSAELGSELYLNLKPVLSQSHLCLFDARELDSLDEIGVEFLQKIFKYGQESDSKFAIANLSQNLWKIWDSQLSSSIPRFSGREEGIRYLESFLLSSSCSAGSPGSTNSQQTGLAESGNGNFSQETWVYCPHCESINVIHEYGDQECGSCGGKFYVQPNLHVSIYEKLL
jgi:anti-anti-sigma regulatory factor